MAIDALDAGKHVLLEKSLAHTLADGERLAAMVVRHPDQAFMIAFNNRYWRDSIVLKQQILAGNLGHIDYAKAGWLGARPNSGSAAGSRRGSSQAAVR